MVTNYCLRSLTTGDEYRFTDSLLKAVHNGGADVLVSVGSGGECLDEEFLCVQSEIVLLVEVNRGCGDGVN